jgi:hypothetical protein
MDGMILLEQARAAGLILTVEGDKLRIVGPKRAEAVARQLLRHKAEVMHALAPPQAIGIGPDDLPGDWRVEWEEHAAIMEYDGRLPRERAEALALTDIVKAMERAGVRPKLSS